MSIDDSSFKRLDYIAKVANPSWLRTLRRFDDLVRPPALRQMEKFERLMHPWALDDMKSFQDKIGAAAAIASKTDSICAKLDWSPRSLAAIDAAHLAIAKHTTAGKAFDSIRKMQEIVQPLGLVDPLRSFERFEDLTKHVLPAAVVDAVGCHLRNVALPSLAFLSMPWHQRVGLLAAIEGPSRGASVIWRDEESDEPAAAIGLMMGPPAEQPNIFIEVRVRCFLCRERLITKDETFQWIGPQRGLLELLAVPVCSSCVKDDPTSYLERIVEALRAGEKPVRFEVIDGGGEGSGKADGRDHLRLVRIEDADDGPGE